MAKSRKAGSRVRNPQEVAKRIITQRLGTKPVRVERESGGLSNLVFTVEHKEGDFILRINPKREKLDPFLKEQWATARASEAGVPVAEILEVGNEPLPYMILRKVTGEAANGHQDYMHILKDLGRYAARINSVRTRGFGGTFDWSHNQLSTNQDWAGFLHNEFELEKRLKTLAHQRMLPPKTLHNIGTILESACGKGRKPALNHGDLRLKNVLVDGKGRISAILDWETCMSSLAPEWELSVALHDLSIDEKQEFLCGYGLPATAFAEIAPTIKALNVINYAAEIERLAEAKDADRLAFYRLRFSGALDLYSL